MIRLEDVHKTYQDGPIEVQALQGIHLVVEKGESLAIMGPSGSGKSTLLHILGCLDHPTSGQYFLDGRDVSEFSDLELARTRSRRIGFMKRPLVQIGKRSWKRKAG